MADTYMDSLMAYLRQFSPNADAGVQGAEPEQITDLEQIVGRPLPDDYRQYLERMGNEGISVSFDGPGSRASNVLSYYQYLRASGQRVPDGYLIIGPGERSLSVALSDLPEREPAVVLMDSLATSRVRPFAQSLPNLLFRQVFTTGNNATLPYFGSAQGHASRDWLDRARQAAGALGLAEQWFSEPSLACYQGKTAAAHVNQYEAGTLNVRIWSQSQEEAERCGAVFGRHLGLKTVPIHSSYTYRPQP